MYYIYINLYIYFNKVKLIDRDDSFVIKEFGLTLIGKILNPKKQNMEKLLQTMPSQWGLAERITANDLGNGKFLLISQMRRI